MRIDEINNQNYQLARVPFWNISSYLKYVNIFRNIQLVSLTRDYKERRRQYIYIFTSRVLSLERHYDVSLTWNSASFQMWMYSLGRALLDTTPRVAALTGTVSVSPSSALQSVLAAMTEPDPRRRASLMNLLDVSL